MWLQKDLYSGDLHFPQLIDFSKAKVSINHLLIPSLVGEKFLYNKSATSTHPQDEVKDRLVILYMGEWLTVKQTHWLTKINKWLYQLFVEIKNDKSNALFQFRDWISMSTQLQHCLSLWNAIEENLKATAVQNIALSLTAHDPRAIFNY